MTEEQKRIENPTCGTCRWFDGEIGEHYGYCFLMPPIVLDKPSCALSYERPGVWRQNFCSHHQSAVVPAQSYRIMDKREVKEFKKHD